jgi:predicted Zn-dependent protease
MIKQIIKALKAHSGVSDWLVSEIATKSHHAFYVMQKLETTRLAETVDYSVTVYHRYDKDGKEFIGSSTFAVPHKLSAKDLTRLIQEAVFASSFVKNKPYDLVKGEKKRSWKEPLPETDPFVLLDQIARVFVEVSSPDYVRFNAMELFHTRTTTHIVNSQGVDLTKTLNKVEVEAIPSFDGEKQKVELYRHYVYDVIDFDHIREDAKEALKDVTARYDASPVGEAKTVDVILKDENVKEFIESLIENYSYADVYRQMTDKKIGDSIQKDVKGEFLTIGLKPSCKADAFDKDGVLLKPMTLVENGILKDHYGSNQYAQYVGMKPNGSYSFLELAKGKTASSAMMKKPHIEIIALSGIQIEMFSGYIGGEVRLGIYFDGKESHPVSGFSFSGNIDACLSDLRTSKESIRISGYQGPKYVRLPNMEIL